MGRNIGPTNKLARRFGVNLGLKTNPNKVARRLAQTPGVHGPKRRRGSVSSFGKQLREKQKVKIIYGLRERQFRGYVERASAATGDSGVNLQKILEKRLDNLVYRMGYAQTRAQARQLVSHGMFLLNGKPINIPSHIVRVGDMLGLKPTKEKKIYFEGISNKLAKHDTPSWVSVDPAKKTGKVLNEPSEQDFEKSFDIKLIVEYYSSR